MNSSLRIGGLASGIDTDQIVKDLMKAESKKLDTYKQDKILNEWRLEQYNEYNKKLASFILETRKEFGIDSYSSTGVLNRNSISSFDWVKSATSSDEDCAEVSTTAEAVTGTYNVHVEKLATNFAVASTGDLANEYGMLRNQFNLADTDVIEFTIESGDGVSHTFKYSGDDLSNLTIRDIASHINSYRDENGKDLGVKAVYDESINRFFFQTKETGAQESFKITKGVDSTVNFLAGTDNKLNLALNYDDVNSGEDGEINFAGANNIKIGSNNVKINGIDMNLKAENVDFTVEVKTDIDKVYDKIKGFVDKYNALVEDFAGKLGEKRYKDFAPLTEEQKAAMSDDEKKMWNEKAQSGLLRNDELFSRCFTNVRSGLYQEVEGSTNGISFLFDIGITTERYNSENVAGKLEINDDKLKNAIKDNVDGVLEVLFKQPDPLETDEIKRKQSGIITRMYSDFTEGMKEVIDKAGPGGNNDMFRKVEINILIDFVTEHQNIADIEKNIQEIDDEIFDMEKYLQNKEDSYWQKFTAMEKALQNMQSQSDWLMQQIGG
ncbi:flagellar filament capping protein FliD [Abyssisolibacter fermentans]|uniref:flagellar filament capping protein FliD n=1 Tax=Abyssisolibacter fermentans TaxID=1766203 RepID=UPI00082B58A2|nr:flagellar filament capping protein FliD [Abyssisolibacter fermentans]